MLDKTKLIELGGLGVAAAMAVTIAPLAKNMAIPSSQLMGAGVVAASMAAVAIVVGKPKS
jgi:hypothetical protein